MGKKYCFMTTGGSTVKCGKPVFGHLRVQVFHPVSGRKTWQTWKLCQNHFVQMLNEEGKGYFATYTKKPNAPVLQCEIKNS